jgi:hypothetical protein
LQREQDPLVRLKLKRLLPPSGPLNEPGGRAGDRNPEYRDASGRRNQQTLWSCRRWRVENATALECRMATTFTARRGGHG